MKFKKSLILSLLFLFCFQFTALALDHDNHKCNDPNSHYTHVAKNILKNKYGIKDDEIEKAQKENKSIFELAKAKGVKEADLKAAIISPKIKAIDEMVSTGQLSKEKGNKLKSKLKESIDKWDGKIAEDRCSDKPSFNQSEEKGIDEDAEEKED